MKSDGCHYDYGLRGRQLETRKMHGNGETDGSRMPHLRSTELTYPNSPKNEHEERPDLGGRKRALWVAYKSIEEVVKKTRNT
ncbi:hypothetical protein RB195_019354 [Necator americanus]|uniref:Uncharacterized protein n=1 Tax=Necator americanus TaxID=51031 RepID=A0ABR1CGL4_NECAM